jgi:hypothetical protein
MKSDREIQMGISILRRQILSGKGGYSHSEIPSIIGSEVHTDTAKIDLFDRIRKCVVEKVYPSPVPKIALFLDCHHSSSPIIVPAHQEVQLLSASRLSDVSWSWDLEAAIPNNTDQPVMWPAPEKIDSFRIFECEIRNMGKVDLSNVSISMRFGVGGGISELFSTEAARLIPLSQVHQHIGVAGEI